MATEPVQPENADSAAPSATEGAPSRPQAAAQPSDAGTAPKPAQPPSPQSSLPPRIDGGEDLENVLGEVSRVFGAAPLAALAEDTINDHLADLATEPAAASPELPKPPKQEVPLETAADLFRATSNDKQAPPNETKPPAATADSKLDKPAQPEADETSLKGEASENKPSTTASGPNTAEPITTGSESMPTDSTPATDTAAPRARFAVARRVIDKTTGALASGWTIQQRLPKRARLAAGLVAAMLLGWIGGAVLTRSSGASTGGERPASDAALEGSAEEMSADKAKITALEEQLEKAQHDREVAAHERDQARERLEQSAALMRTEQQSNADRRARDEASRKKALAEFQKAEEHLHLMELRAYDAQLARVRDCWQRSPGLAAGLLDDRNGCPPKLRDFAWGYFYGRAKNDRATWRGAAPLNAVAWSPDGTLVASAAQDGSIVLRDGVSGKQVAQLAAHAGGVSALAFSQRGDWLASAGADSTVKLWAVASRRLEATFHGHLGVVLCVAIAPDASALVSGGDDGTVKFWDVASRRAVATRWGCPRSHEPDDSDDPTRYVRAVAFSPDGRLVASGGYQVVRIWDSNALERTTLAVSDGEVGALAFSPDSTTLAIGSEGSISLRDVDSLLVRSGPQAVDAPVNALTFAADGARLAAALGEQGLIFNRIARPSSDNRRQEVPPKLAAVPAAYDLANPRRLSGHDGLVTGVAFAPGAETAATSGADGTVRLWDSRGGIVDKTQADTVLREIPRAAALAYSPDSRCLAVGTSDSIRLWDVRGGFEMARLANRGGDVGRLAFSPDGAHLASAGRDWPILIWAVRAQRVEMALNGHTAGVNSLAYAADGKALISAGDDGTLRLWNATNGQAIANFTGLAGPALSAALSPDGKFAASGGTDQKIRLWSVERKQTLATLSGHGSPVVALAFSPDGQFLVSAESRSAGVVDAASAAADTSASRPPLRLWQLPKGNQVLAFGPSGADVYEISFSPDSKTLAVSGPRGVTLWDPRTGEIRETLRLPRSPGGEVQGVVAKGRPAWPIAFSPDGLSLAAGGDAALSIWNSAPFAAASGEKASVAP